MEKELRRREDEAKRLDVETNAELIRARCTRLIGFVREAWHILEPGKPFVHGWAIRALAEHLEAVSRGEITRLLFNVPPGMMKSLLVTVFWPAWEWIARPDLRYVSTTFDAHNAVRDTRRMRTLIQSEWYQKLFPSVGPLIRSAEGSFENGRSGWREASAFGSLTGKRGDRLLIDDPHSTKMAESEALRKETLRVFREDVPSRINDSMESAIVIIMQRVHMQDVSALAKEFGYTCVVLPMEFEVDTRCETKIGFIDPRKTEGELLFPERFPREAVERDKGQMLAYAVAAQFQQRPAPREGGLFKRASFEGKMVDAAPPDCVWWRHWDLAASLKKVGAHNQAWTAGVKMGFSPSLRRWYVANVTRFQQEGHQVRVRIRTVAIADGPGVKVSIPRDPGAGGKYQAQDFIAALSGFEASMLVEHGEKQIRAEPFAAQCAAGNVYLVAGDWVTAYLDELCVFPSSAAKDQVDASSACFQRLSGPIEVRLGMMQVGADDGGD